MRASLTALVVLLLLPHPPTRHHPYTYRSGYRYYRTRSDRIVFVVAGSSDPRYAMCFRRTAQVRRWFRARRTGIKKVVDSMILVIAKRKKRSTMRPVSGSCSRSARWYVSYFTGRSMRANGQTDVCSVCMYRTELWPFRGHGKESLHLLCFHIHDAAGLHSVSELSVEKRHIIVWAIRIYSAVISLLHLR